MKKIFGAFLLTLLMLAGCQNPCQQQLDVLKAEYLSVQESFESGVIPLDDVFRAENNYLRFMLKCPEDARTMSETEIYRKVKQNLQTLWMSEKLKYEAGTAPLETVLAVRNDYLEFLLECPEIIRGIPKDEICKQIKRNLQDIHSLRLGAFQAGGIGLYDVLEAENDCLEFQLKYPEKNEKMTGKEIRKKLKKNLEEQIQLKKMELEAGACTQEEIQAKEEELKRLQRSE